MKKILFILLLTALFLLHVNTAASDLSKTKNNDPQISVNRTNLNFGAVVANHSTQYMTGSQDILISNSGGGTLNWEITADEDWLICTPKFGTGSGTVQVNVAPCSLNTGTHNGTITVSSPDAANSPQTIDVNLDVLAPSQDQPPFGSFSTPDNNSNVSSSVPVTGWVLDDVKVDNVKIYNGASYVGDAIMVEGARPDVEQSYPNYPNNYQAGWGYMMLTNFLPNGGNGTFTINVYAEDNGGNKTLLGSKTIICDNEHAVKPFGAIDTPLQGGSASGSSYVNWGWALTPQPKHIPTDGSTINVWVDGVDKGHPNYNLYRQDIADLFPDYQNSGGAAGYFQLDTTAYADGVHTIYWTASDSASEADGIGSRYFTINNTGNRQKASAAQDRKPLPMRIGNPGNLPADQFSPVRVTRGFGNDTSRDVYPGSEGFIRTQIKEVELIRIDLSTNAARITDVSGGLLVGGHIRSLPIGSTLDSNSGVFSWIPGPGFLGEYHLVFIFSEKGSSAKLQKHVFITVVPKS